MVGYLDRGSGDYCGCRGRFQDGGSSASHTPLAEQRRVLNGPGQVIERDLDVFCSGHRGEFAAASVEVWPKEVEVVGRLGFCDFSQDT
jgi:hypothetical protein